MNRHFPLNNVSPLKYFLSIAVLMGIVFYFISSVGSADESTLLHKALVFFQWQLQSIIPMCLMILAHISLSRSSLFSSNNPWLRVGVSGVIGATLFTPIALFVDIYVMGEVFPVDLSRELVDELVGVLPPVVLFWLLVNSPFILGMDFRKKKNTGDSREPIDRGKGETDAQKAEQEGKEPLANAASSLFEKQIYPITLAETLRISSELHYLDIVSSAQHKLVLYSLKDAVNQLPTDLGMQVHRSHWVAYKAIVEFKRNGRQGSLLLSNGDLVPVSRGYVALVTEQLSDRA